MVFTRRQSRFAQDSADVTSPSKSSTPSFAPQTPSKIGTAKSAVASSTAKKTSKAPLYGQFSNVSTASLASTGDHGVDLISTLKSQASNVNVTPRTTPIKPPATEMHPGRHKHASSTPYDEAQWLGFFKMQPKTEPRQIGSKIHNALPDSPTPVKVARSNNDLRSQHNSQFEFTFRREVSLGLSDEAKAVMAEHRAEAARIRAELAEEAKQNSLQDATFVSAAGRKMAKPKGRYSDVHKSAFNQMDSIANHASAWRTKSNKHTNRATPAATRLSKPSSREQIKNSPLKRTRSKIDLGADGPESKREAKVKHAETSREFPLPGAKRTKNNFGDDAGTTRPRVQESSDSTPVKATKSPGFFRSNLLTPTKSSLARAKSASNLLGSKLPTLARTTSMVNLLSPASKAHHKPQPTTNHMTKPSSSHQLANSRPTSSSSNVSTGGNFRRLDVEHQAHTPKSTMDNCEKRSIPSPTPIKMQVIANDQPPAPLVFCSPEPHSKLRKIRSILRTPQRLYSDDPKKIAAGTHHATPPDPMHGRSIPIPATAPVLKHVDFSASALIKAARDEAKAVSVEPESLYPVLPQSMPRRQTMAFPSIPGDFTFRAGSEIKFGPCPISTIRQVQPADDLPPAPTATNPIIKRKRVVATSHDQVPGAPESDKENDDRVASDRPMKRLRTVSANLVQKAKTVVKKARTAPSSSSKIPKRAVAGGLSASRLAFLAQPKKRT